MTEALYVLKILGDDEATLRSFRLAAGDHLVGSLPECAVPILEKGVSRRHARLEVLRDGGVTITDLGSKNGTVVNGQKIRQIAVTEYAVVAFGPVSVVLYAVDEAVAGMAVVAADTGEPSGPRSEARSEQSTRVTSLLELMADGLRDLFVPLAQRSLTAEAAAVRLARSWLTTLPVDRVELLRLRDGGDVVVAEASRAARTATPPRQIRFAAGDWALRLETSADAPFERLRAFMELVLDLLAAAGPPASGGGRAAADEPPLPDDAEPPPPGSLDAEMRALYRRCRKIARGEIPLVILGESGSGKEVLARWIHERSRRAAGPFLAVNCAALPRDLLEAELFGIERGVATGVEARPGLLEQASGGTLFLDEIGDMPIETQAKILRVLENTQLLRVGGRRPIRVDVRFVAATHRNLEEAVETGSFRRDLYHRLAAFVAALPPLRERCSDVALLAAHFFHREVERLGVASPGITRAAMAALVDYAWPGNVRELHNEIAAAVLLVEPGEPVDRRHLSERLGGATAPAGERPLSLDEAVTRAERQAFDVALAVAAGNHSRAMELLGVPRTTYYRKLKELDAAR